MMLTRARRLAGLRMGLAAILLVAPMWNMAAADVLVLRNGGRIEGTLANKEVVARDPFSFTHVTFLQVPESRAAKLLSFAVADVEYILIETETGERVIDFHMKPQSTTDVPGSDAIQIQPRQSQPRQAQPLSYGPSDRSKGIAMFLFGAGVEIVAIAIPFKSNWYYSYNGTSTQRVDTGNTYNAGNYILMGVGGACMLGGLMMIEQSRQRERSSVSTWSFPGGAGLRKTWKF